MESGRFSNIPARAAFDSRLDPAPFRLLAVLGTYGNTAGFCFPTQGLLAARAGISRQAINKHMAELERLGYVQVIRDEEQKLEVLRRYCNRRENVSGCVYRILHDVLPDQPDPEDGDLLEPVNSTEKAADSKSATGLFDSAKRVQPEVAPPPRVKREVAGGATSGVAGGATSEVDNMNVPGNVPTNDGAAAVGFWTENLNPAETVAVAKLIALGFERLDAINQTRKRGPGQVEIAIANSESVAANGDLLSRRGYIVKCIREGWPLKESDPVVKARKAADERAEQQRLRDQSIASRRSADERLDQQIADETAELFEFTDSMPAGQFEEIATAVLKDRQHLRPPEGRNWRRYKPLCRAIRMWRDANQSAGLVLTTEAAPC